MKFLKNDGRLSSTVGLFKQSPTVSSQMFLSCQHATVSGRGMKQRLESCQTQFSIRLLPLRPLCPVKLDSESIQVKGQCRSCADETD
jgi:hypothetical protein